MKKREVTQQKTIDSFRRIDDRVWSLVYENDYKLDKLLQKGVSSTPGLLRFMVKEMSAAASLPKKGDFACSSFNAFTPSGEQILGRNFDYMDAPLIVVWTAPEGKYRSLSVANCTFMLYGKKSIAALKPRAKSRLLFAPYCAMDGVNETGLAIAVLEIKTKATKQKTGKVPLTTTTVIRTVLDTCRTCEEAIEVFRTHDMNDAIFCNYHFHIMDGTGNNVIIEYVDNEMKVVRPDESGLLRLANFFLSEGGDNRKGFGHERYDYIGKTLSEKGGVITESDGMKMLENCHLDYKHKRGYQIITLWSAVYNAEKKTMKLCAGLNYDVVYTFDLFKPGEVVCEGREEAAVPEFMFRHKDKEMV